MHIKNPLFITKQGHYYGQNSALKKSKKNIVSFNGLSQKPNYAPNSNIVIPLIMTYN